MLQILSKLAVISIKDLSDLLVCTIVSPQMLGPMPFNESLRVLLRCSR